LSYTSLKWAEIMHQNPTKTITKSLNIHNYKNTVSSKGVNP